MKRLFLSIAMAGGMFLTGAAWAAESSTEWRIERGPDGRAVAVPPGGTAVSGTDGRIIAVPPGWQVEYGPDARAVAVPPGGTVRSGVDGRLVAVPEGWTVENGLDGRAVAVPPGGRTVRGRDERSIAVPEGWTVETGPDGRVVAVPPGGTTVQGRDERLIAIPEGWDAGVGSNERVIAIPTGGEIAEGADGMAVPVPPVDFEWDDPLIQFCILDAQAQWRVWIVTVDSRSAQVWKESMNVGGVDTYTGHVEFDDESATFILTDSEYHALLADLAGQEAAYHSSFPFNIPLGVGQGLSYVWSMVSGEGRDRSAIVSEAIPTD